MKKGNYFSLSSFRNTKIFNYKTITSFEDACEVLNLDPNKFPDLSGVPLDYRRSIIAYHKLLIIYKAINDIWTPNYKNYYQVKFYPWIKGELIGSSSTRTHSYIGNLCCDSPEKAEFIIEHFKDEYIDYLLLPR
ncbi:MAG: hypothetical protein ABSF81_07790 [Bacteroidales bacterium]|jgi:hypothetical protein